MRFLGGCMMKSAMRKMILFSLLFALMQAFPVQAAPEQRLALVIGNAVYGFSPLKNPITKRSALVPERVRLAIETFIHSSLEILGLLEKNEFDRHQNQKYRQNHRTYHLNLQNQNRKNRWRHRNHRH